MTQWSRPLIAGFTLLVGLTFQALSLQAADIVIPIDEFEPGAHQFLNPDHENQIKTMAWSHNGIPAHKNLLGVAAFQDPDNENKWTPVQLPSGKPTGWIQYEFEVPTGAAGWYKFEYQYDWRVARERNYFGFKYSWIFDVGTANAQRLDMTKSILVRAGTASNPIGQHKVGYIYLGENSHTLRAERWAKYGHEPITHFLLTRIGSTSLHERVQVIANPHVHSDLSGLTTGEYRSVIHHFMRPNESFDIQVIAGESAAINGGRSVLVQVIDRATGATVQEYPPITLGDGITRQIVTIGAGTVPPGQYKLKYMLVDAGTVPATKIAIEAGANLPELPFDVIDPTPIDVSGQPDNRMQKRQLGETILCSNPADYAGGDGSDGPRTQVGNLPSGGPYLETGTYGYMDRSGSSAERRAWLATTPHWFGYPLASLPALPTADNAPVSKLPGDAPYEIEIEYPDDATRSTVFKIMDQSPSLLWAATGVDTGFEFPNTDSMQTMRLLYWPNDGRQLDSNNSTLTSQAPRVVVQNVHTHWRSACSTIRVYQVDAMPFMQVDPNGRQFTYWFEEPDRWLVPFGGRHNYSDAGNPSPTPEGMYEGAERWMRTMRHLGVDTIFLQVNAYNLTLWPSLQHYRYDEGGIFPPDYARLILMLAEKYAIKVVAAFHPSGDELVWQGAMNGDAEPFQHLAINKNGYAYQDIYYQGRAIYPGARGADNGSLANRSPKFTPTHPTNRAWIQGATVEFVNRYKNESALIGVSLRTSNWTNSGLNNWENLDWGYDDYSAENFAGSVNIYNPGTPAERFTAFNDLQVFDGLQSYKDAWLAWRAEQVKSFYQGYIQAIRAADPRLNVYSLIDLKPGNPLYEAGLRDDHGVAGLTYAYGPRYGRKLYTNDEAQLKAHILERRADLVLPQKLGALGSSRAIKLTAEYMEDARATIPSANLGLNYPALMTSAHIMPSGRYNLERYALALAYTDANHLINGGNTNFIDQDNIREFMAEYRQLPPDAFELINNVSDPVVIRHLNKSGSYYFYLVNRTADDQSVTLTLSDDTSVESLSSGVALSSQARELTLALQPFQLKAFKISGAGANIVNVSMDPGDLIFRVSFDGLGDNLGSPAPLTYTPVAQDIIPPAVVLHRLDGSDAVSDVAAIPHVIDTQGMTGVLQNGQGMGFVQNTLAAYSNGILPPLDNETAKRHHNSQTGWVSQHSAGPLRQESLDTRNGLTIETQVRIDQFIPKTTATTGQSVLVSQYGTNRTDFALLLVDPAANGTGADVRLEFKAFGITVPSTSNQALALIGDGRLHHIAGVVHRDFATDTTGQEIIRLELYVDGQRLNAVTVNFNEITKSSPNTIRLDRIGIANSGRSTWGGNGNDRGLMGVMDALAISNARLDQQSFILTAQPNPLPEYVVYHLSFDALAGNSLAAAPYPVHPTDKLPLGFKVYRLHGLDPAQTDPVPRVLDTADAPQGGRGFVQAPPSTGYANDRTLSGWITHPASGQHHIEYAIPDGLTVEALIRVDGFSPNAGLGYENIISQISTSRTDFSLQLLASPSGGAPMLRFKAHGNSVEGMQPPNVDIVGDGRWHHVAGVIRRHVEASDNPTELARLEIYLDGERLAVSADYDISPAATNKNKPDTLILDRIGFGNEGRGFYGTPDTDRGFQGAMDAAAITAKPFGEVPFALPLPDIRY